MPKDSSLKQSPFEPAEAPILGFLRLLARNIVRRLVATGRAPEPGAKDGRADEGEKSSKNVSKLKGKIQ